MKKRIIALLLAGGLLAGLCGCGGSGGDSLPPEPAITEEHIPMEVVEEVAPEDSESEEPEEPEDPKTTEVENEQSTWEGEDSESGNASDIDVDKLLTTRAVEFEDMDGYRIRETCQVSPIFTEDDMETMRALWVALGNDIAIFPSQESFYDAKHMGDFDAMEYIIGTYMVENLTDGFAITPNNPRSYDGVLAPMEDSSVHGWYKEESANYFRYSAVTMVSYTNGTKYYKGTNYAGTISRAKMDSDTWGPRTFIMAIPNVSTPNQPEGYRYDELQIILCGNFHMNKEEYAVFELEYYTKEVE